MSPQKENGFTPLAHELLEAFYRCKMTEYERVIVMCIWRKTYGWSKTEDWIANSQFHEETGIPKPHITRTIKTLRAKNIIARTGKKVSVNKKWNEWKVEWRVTSTGNRVTPPGNKKLPHQVPTKEKKETITKETSKSADLQDNNLTMETNYNPLGAEVIKLFETVDPKNKTYYANKTQRGACDFLITEYGLAEIEKRTNVLPKTNGMPFFPNITTPCQLRDKWVQLDNAINRAKAEQQTKSDNVIW